MASIMTPQPSSPAAHHPFARSLNVRSRASFWADSSAPGAVLSPLAPLQHDTVCDVVIIGAA
jgi:hypothetical protein